MLSLFLPFFFTRHAHSNTTSVIGNLSMVTNYLNCDEVDSAARKKIFMFFYATVMILGIPSNVFSLYVAWQHIRQKNELGVYLFSLALSDLSFLISLSMWLDFLWRGIWVHGNLTCFLSVSILFCNFYTSMALLCCIAIDRYLAVVHPFKYHFLRTVGTATVVTVAIWVVMVCFIVTTLTREGVYSENDDFSRCFKSVLPLPRHMVQMNVTRFFMGFILPVLLVVFSTWRICEALESSQATKKEERKQISRLLTVVLLCLLICFGPIHITTLLLTVVTDCKYGTLLLYLEKISVAISSINCLADPCLYCFITRSGKEQVNQVVLFFQVKKRSKDGSMV